jgi:PAS domain S-box-containing protein
MCRILGWPADELITKSFQDITHPDDLAVELAQIEQMRAGKIGSYVIDKRSLRKDGTTVWIRRTVSCVRKNDGSVDYFVSVVEDISARKQAEEELHRSEERFKSSLFHAPLPIVLFDDREQILALSQSWIEQTGYSREELNRIENWTARAHGERSSEVLEHVRQIMSIEPGAHASERIIHTKDGRERLWNFVSSPLGSQSDGRRLFVCIAQDVTERKAHEEQVQLLMREINHRAKNLLSLVQAIARQAAAREPEDFIERFSERVRALAANQDLLVWNAWQGVDVGDLVRAQLAHFADLVGSRIAVHGPKLRLNAVAAQAVGLALHELATNAGKYGAMSVDASRVDVWWRLDGDTFVMGWTERNGPPVSPPDRRGFGSTVVDSMAKRTLDGEVQLDYAPSGLVWHLTCPAANALEQTGHHGQISRATENCNVTVVPFPGGRGNSHQWPKGCGSNTL